MNAFVKFNIGASRSDPTKYITDAELARLWTVGHTIDPKNYQSQSPPWSLLRTGGRPAKLKKLFEDPNVPAEFKLTLVQKSGFLARLIIIIAKIACNFSIAKIACNFSIGHAHFHERSRN